MDDNPWKVAILKLDVQYCIAKLNVRFELYISGILKTDLSLPCKQISGFLAICHFLEGPALKLSWKLYGLTTDKSVQKV